MVDQHWMVAGVVSERSTSAASLVAWPMLNQPDMFRSCQMIRELCSLIKLYYSIHNSIRICKRGVVAAYHVVWECVVEQWLGGRG